MNTVEIKINFDGFDLERRIVIDENLDKFVDDMLDNFDSILRDIVALKDFGTKWDESSNVQKVLIDSHIDKLRDE